MLLAGEIVEEHVRNPGTVGDERELAAVRRPLRIQIESILTRQDINRPALYVHHFDAPLRELENCQVALRTAISGEGDAAAIG